MPKCLKVVAVAVACLLGGCGDSSVSSTCFNNGEHESMSDGRITRICNCRIKEARVERLEAKDQKLLSRIIAGKEIDASDQKRAQELSNAWNKSAAVCSVLK